MDESVVTIWAAMIGTLQPPFPLFFRRNSWDEGDLVLVYRGEHEEFPHKVTLRRKGKEYIPTEEDMAARDWDTYDPPAMIHREVV